MQEGCETLICGFSNSTHVYRKLQKLAQEHTVNAGLKNTKVIKI